MEEAKFYTFTQGSQSSQIHRLRKIFGQRKIYRLRKIFGKRKIYELRKIFGKRKIYRLRQLFGKRKIWAEEDHDCLSDLAASWLPQSAESQQNAAAVKILPINNIQFSR